MREMPIDRDAEHPFSQAFVRRLGFTGKMIKDPNWLDIWTGWNRGTSLLWKVSREYFVNRLNDLGREGWELAEPLESHDQYGVPIVPESRFELEHTQVSGLFGLKDRALIVGARFMMRRTTLE